jgi:hypothetical protein
MDLQVQCFDVAGIVYNCMGERPKVREPGILAKRTSESCFRVATTNAAGVSQLCRRVDMDVKERRAELFSQVSVVFDIAHAVDHYIALFWDRRRELFAEPPLTGTLMYLTPDTLQCIAGHGLSPFSQYPLEDLAKAVVRITCFLQEPSRGCLA